MVVIHIKKTETDQFLFVTSVKESTDVVIRQLVFIWNTRLRIQRLVAAARELAKHGPSKPEELRGLDEVEDSVVASGYGESKAGSRGKYYNPDPLGQRTGDAPSPEAAATLNRTCDDAEELISKV